LINQGKSIPDTLKVDIESLFRSRTDVIETHRGLLDTNESLLRTTQEAQQEAETAIASKQQLEIETQALMAQISGLEGQLKVQHDRAEEAIRCVQDVERREVAAREDLRKALGTFVGFLTSALQQHESLACGCEVRVQLPADVTSSSNAIDAMKLVALDLEDGAFRNAGQQNKVLCTCTTVAQHLLDVLWEEIHATHTQLHICEGNVEATEKRVCDELSKVRAETERAAQEASVEVSRIKAGLQQEQAQAVADMRGEIAKVTDKLTLEAEQHRFVCLFACSLGNGARMYIPFIHSYIHVVWLCV
jgi:hypothetical protein